MTTPTSDAKNQGMPPLRHAWKQCICLGMAQEVLRADVQHQLRFLQREIGYRYIRFHASFHDHLGVVQKTADGRVRYCWALLDKIYDALVELGFDPIFELNPMPKAIASGDQKMFHPDFGFNVTPPVSWQAWEDLTRACVEHCVERYGLPRVRRWMFECWNEPNLSGFWTGSEQDYYELYAASARAVKAVDPEIPVGGPASARGEWCLPFAQWCRDNDVPLDFISYHAYPMDEYGQYPQRKGSPHAPGQHFVELFRNARRLLDENGFEGLPHVITEWNTQHCDEDGNTKWVGTSDCTRLFSGAAALHYTYETEPYVDAFGWWTASDIMHEAGVTNQPFGGHIQHYGMINLEGVPKPVFHAFKYLARMTGPRLPADLGARPAQANGIVTDETVTTRALLWNFHMPEEPSQDWAGALRLPLPEPMRAADRVRVMTATVAEHAGSAYETWRAMDEPHSLTRLESEAILAAAQPRHAIHILPVDSGFVDLPYRVGRNEVLFAEISGPNVRSAEQVSAEVAKLNQQLEYPGDQPA